MPTFPSNPTITSRLSTGSALTYTQMDTNFGNLTASIDSVIIVTAQTASYVATAQTASSVSPLIQTVIISGSLFITGSPVRLVGLPTTEPLITGSLWLSGSGEGAATGSKYLMVFNG